MVSFLGKLTDRTSRSLYFSGKEGIVIQSTSTENGSIVQAFKRLVLAEANLKKGVPLDQLQTILSTYDASLEISSATPSEDWVRKLEPLDGKRKGIVKSALERVDKALKEEEKDYLEWKGVRDLDEAHYNLKKRQDEISDLNQKLYHNSLEPQFVYNPGHPLRKGVSAWQTNDRVHFRELKDQAKERASAVRLRIDFTRRKRIKDLKDKRKNLLEELEAEKRRERDYAKTITSIVESGSAVSVSVVVRSKAVHVVGKKDAVVKACEADVLDAAARLRVTLKERFGLILRDGQAIPLFDSDQQKALVPAEDFERHVGKITAEVIGKVPWGARIPEIRYPQFQAAKRFAYLGLALRDDFSRTTYPILYDLDEQGPRHTSVVGGSGSGKSVAASLIVEGAATNGVPVIVFDPTGSWTGLAEPCTSKSLFDLYPDFGLGPSQARGFDLRVVVPKGPEYEPGILDEALHGSEISIFTSDSLTSSQEAAFASSFLNDLLERMRAWPESKALRLMLVFEEAHRYLGERILEPVLEVFARTARARGVGLLIVSQVAVDLPPAIRNNCGTKIQMFTNYSGDLSRAAQTFGTEYRKLIPRFSKGQGAITYPEFGNALVAFRPPLHSTAGLPPSTFQFFHSVQELGQIAATLTRHATTNDAAGTPHAQAGETCSRKPIHAKSAAATATPKSWRDIVTRFKDAKASASTMSEAIADAGLRPPSLRTIQRYTAAGRVGKRDFENKSVRE